MIEGQELIKILKDNAPDGDEMYFCSLMNIFNEEDKHCAVFCNLADDFLELGEFLLISHTLSRNPFKIYVMLLNAIIEKIDAIKYVSNDEEFMNLIKIRRWANFFKHPKSFLFIHHPYYVYNQGDEYATDKLIINTDFVLEYYRKNCKKKDGELREMLMNKINIEVSIPNLKELTQGFCNDVNKLIDMIKNDRVLVDKLMPHNINIEEYYEYD